MYCAVKLIALTRQLQRLGGAELAVLLSLIILRCYHFGRIGIGKPGLNKIYWAKYFTCLLKGYHKYHRYLY